MTTTKDQASDGIPATDVSGVPGGVPGDGTRTLAIDVGGSGLKAAVLDATGAMIGDRARVPTPYPCPPEVLVRALIDLVASLPSYGRVSVGFPGMVRTGCVLSAPNLSRVAGRGSKVSADLRRAWAGVDLAGLLEEALGAPIRVVNDAEMQGAAVVRGRGLEMVVTLGTGCGTALFLDGRLAPHLELGQHPFRKDETYDEVLGDSARKGMGNARWNRRVAQAVRTLDVLLRFDRLYIGGGNSQRITVALGPNVELVDNVAGILGGVRLWDTELTCDAAARPRAMASTSGRPDDRDQVEEDAPMDIADLTDLLREAEEHHGPYEATAPEHHWSGWYAAYISARQQGRTPDESAEDAALYMERQQAEQGGSS